MSTSTTRPRLSRRTHGGVLGGVASGIAAHLNVDPNLVRVGFVVLTLAGGAGAVAYAVLWLLLPAEGDDQPGPLLRRFSGQLDVRLALGLASITLGALLLVRAAGFTLPDWLLWPTVCMAAGFAVLWSPPNRDAAEASAEGARSGGRTPLAAGLAAITGTERGARVRLVFGSLLVLGGIATLLATTGAFQAVRQALLAAVIVGAGLALLLGPWLGRLASALAAERRERVRADERAEVAAHLHDSVLHTLALVQRRADDPREVRALARRQERELRSWIAGERPTTQREQTLGVALEEVASDLEVAHGVAVDVVRVGGDTALDESLESLIAATREAIRNAAQHSGAHEVSVYVEVGWALVTVFVRDRGRGFDPAAVPADRHGISESIEGRMRRHGGEAIVRTSGVGTEVELRLPRVAA